MSKMHEYTAKVTVRLAKTMTVWGRNEGDVDLVIRAWPDCKDFLKEFDEGHIKVIEVGDIERIQ